MAETVGRSEGELHFTQVDAIIATVDDQVDLSADSFSVGGTVSSDWADRRSQELIDNYTENRLTDQEQHELESLVPWSERISLLRLEAPSLLGKGRDERPPGSCSRRD